MICQSGRYVEFLNRLFQPTGTGSTKSFARDADGCLDLVSVNRNSLKSGTTVPDFTDGCHWEQTSRSMKSGSTAAGLELPAG